MGNDAAIHDAGRAYRESQAGGPPPPAATTELPRIAATTELPRSLATPRRELPAPTVDLTVSRLPAARATPGDGPARQQRALVVIAVITILALGIVGLVAVLRF